MTVHTHVLILMYYQLQLKSKVFIHKISDIVTGYSVSVHLFQLFL